MQISETSVFRHLFVDYCQGNGIDLGYGGDPIVPSAITVDLPNQYANVGTLPRNLSGDARDLYWFNDEVLSWVFSSHLLEDFENTEEVLREWLRVIKPGGYLLLLLPEQRVYVECCRNGCYPPNPNHKKADFGIAYVKEVLQKIGVPVIKDWTAEELSSQTGKPEYNFAIIARKEK